MKIIDNKKDFYDYLVDYYGMDEYVVYDRRKSTVISKELLWFLNKKINPETDKEGSALYKVSLWAGRTHRSMYLTIDVDLKKNTKTFTWETVEEVREKDRNKENKYWLRWFIEMNQMEDDKIFKEVTEKTPLVLVIDPIRYSSRRLYHETEIYKNPILTNTFFCNILTANEIWEGIYNYLLECKEPKIEDNRNDIEHLESHGFDKITSFRNVK